MQGAIDFCRGYFQMCAAAALVILVVFALRLCMRRMPKNMLCLLWMAVFFRLLCPVAIQGPIPDLWSQNRAGQQTPAEVGGELPDGPGAAGSKNADTGLWQDSGGTGKTGGIQGAADAWGMSGESDPAYGKEHADAEKENTESTAPVHARTVVGAAWQDMGEQFGKLQGTEKAVLLCGFAAMLGTAVFLIWGIRRYAALARLTKTAVKSAVKPECGGRRTRVLECAGTPVPMVFGLLHPAVYLPAGFAGTVSARERELILRHEEAHIRRGDHMLKVFSWAALCLHWWNPLVWMSVRLFQKDMEMACDEYVLSHAGADVRAEYASALLHFSMKHSGLVFPAAFGESNTQKRVQNILQYHKKPVAFTALTLCAACVLAVCLATNPHTVENAQGDPKDEGIPAGTDKPRFASMEEAGAYYLACWQEKLSAKESGESAAGKKVWYLGGEERKRPGEDRWQAVMSFCTLDEATGIPTVYQTRVNCTGAEDGEICVEDVEEESFAHVTTAQQARRMGAFPFRMYFGQDQETGSNCAGKITEKGMFSSGMWQFELQDAGTATAMLLHLEGGSAEFQRRGGFGEECGYVTYTFADGSAITCEVSRGVARLRGTDQKQYWFPESILDDAAAGELVERARLAEQYVESAAFRTLQDAADIREFSGDYGKLQDGFVMLDQAEGRDIALYGLVGGDAMVLRDGQDCYPIYLFWTSPQMHIPQIYAGDYDDDGQTEYALWTHMRTGTGYSGSQLYIIERTQDGISLHGFGDDALARQFERVGYDWDSEGQTLRMKVDGEQTDLQISLQKLLENDGGEQLQFRELCFHDISDFIEKDGQWYYWTQSGIALEDWALLSYECGVEAQAPVIYRDGEFSLGEITLTEYSEGE